MSDPATQFDFDVFISYSSHDKTWVRGELLERIEKAGLKAFIDYRDFTRGAPSIKECERGVVKSRKTLLVLTPNYIASEWCEFEAVMGQTLSPANRDLRMIPLLKTECEKPLRINALTHVDFTDGADHDLAWRQLLTALGKAPEPAPPKEPKRDDWFLAHPYLMPPNFTGRIDERSMLTVWLNADPAHPLLVLRALGGFGKSALTWHWLMHDVDPVQWPRVVWWSFYETDASLESFVAKALGYLSNNRVDVSAISPREQIDKLVAALHQTGILLMLDGFERLLRAFGGLDAAYQGDDAQPAANDRDCISPLAEIFLRALATVPGIGGKMLLTTRLNPHVLEAHGGAHLIGCRDEELIQLQPGDAVNFFHAQGIRGGRAEIETACAPYGYHPLSLRLLAGLIVGDFQQPGDIAAAGHLDVSGDLVQRRHHVLEQSYSRLTPARQELLSNIACFRGPVNYDALKTLAKSTTTLDADLRDLVARELLHHDRKAGRFDLHPIVRRYAYDRLTAPDRTTTHTRLRDYFAAVPTVSEVKHLEDLAPVIELYHHTVCAGQYDQALRFFHDRISRVVYFQFGAYRLQSDLLRTLFADGEDRLPSLKDEISQGWTLNSLAISYSLSGQPLRALPLFEQAIAFAERQGNKKNFAISLGNLAQMAQIHIGALHAAEASLGRRIALSRDIKDSFSEAIGYLELGRLLAVRGVYIESKKRLATALKIFEELRAVPSQSVAWAYRALRLLLWLRSSGSSEPRAARSALDSAHRTLELAEEAARTIHAYPRDYVRSHWMLGAAHRVAGQADQAEHHLHEALEGCRRINVVEEEADILIDLARLRAATGAPDEAKRLAEEALLISERSRLRPAGRGRAPRARQACPRPQRQAHGVASCHRSPPTCHVRRSARLHLQSRLRRSGSVVGTVRRRHEIKAPRFWHGA